MQTGTRSRAESPVMVAGAAGFIGYHVARALLDAGASVIGVDSLNAHYDPALKRARLAEIGPDAGFRFEHLDLADREATADLFARVKPAAVVHLAARANVRHSLTQPHAYTADNIEAFLNVLEGCRANPVRHLIYASTSAVYGGNSKVPFHEDDPVCDPRSLYGATKRANEMMAHSYAHLFKIPASGLRFFTVYGPWGRPDMATWLFTRAILEGQPINVFNHPAGEMSRDFTYVDDVVEGIVRLLDKPPSGEIPHTLFNIGNHTPVRLGQFIDTLESVIGRKGARVLKPMAPGDVLTTYADVSKLAAATGFTPKTSLEDGLARFVSWYRAYHYLDKAA